MMYNNPMMVGGYGPHEKQSNKTEVERPVILTLMRCAVYTVIGVLIVVEVNLIGPTAGPLLLIAFVVLTIDIDLDRPSIAIKTAARNKLGYVLLLALGGVLTLLLLYDAWLVYWDISDSMLWISTPIGSTSIPVYWLWVRFAGIALTPVFIALAMLLDKRLRGEVIAPSWFNSLKAKAAEATGEIADSLGMHYPAAGADAEEGPQRTAVPNPPVY